jgi:hypothetical protein
MRNAYKILMANLRERDNLGGLSVLYTERYKNLKEVAYEVVHKDTNCAISRTWQRIQGSIETGKILTSCVT